ncbi:MAG: Lon protease [Alphaproteobacteria bacterium MarineAlpha5_Bin11]|nr:peptidase S16 [Pelagibacteraceae bacterium]PPR44795.1 MAG: Lon protease [Alphaproteobacteria bacterium MarineAlpha5_Bin11]PPR50222.1 MAG: Lon protease [Alphaproteobacteria bacterium MarineAlpha5_Bin10]|tara:strand:+ start:5312 stop:5941 length:630 start_codon:yes stop_codon:yes gene_type:complete
MNIESLPLVIPIFPLDGALLLPKGNLPLNIFEPRYIQMLDYSMKNEKMIGMIQINQKSKKTNGLYTTGCLGKITQYNETDDGRYMINLSGVIRFHFVKEEKTNEKFRKLTVDYSAFKNDITSNFKTTIDNKEFLNEVKNYLAKNDIKVNWSAIDNIDQTVLITSLASICPFSIAEKQMILESPDIKTIPERMLSLFKMSYTGTAEERIN